MLSYKENILEFRLKNDSTTFLGHTIQIKIEAFYDSCLNAN